MRQRDSNQARAGMDCEDAHKTKCKRPHKLRQKARPQAYWHVITSVGGHVDTARQDGEQACARLSTTLRGADKKFACHEEPAGECCVLSDVTILLPWVPENAERSPAPFYALYSLASTTVHRAVPGTFRRMKSIR
jgi:hypothetical protein